MSYLDGGNTDTDASTFPQFTVDKTETPRLATESIILIMSINAHEQVNCGIVAYSHRIKRL